VKCDSRGNNRGPQQLYRKCSANFSTKALICLNPTLDSAQVGLMREFCCGVLWLRYRLPMTQERLSNVVLTAALVVVAAVWLWFVLAYAEWIFRH